MKKLACLALLIACSDDPSPPAKGTYGVSWMLAGTTCDAAKIADIVVTTTDSVTGDTQSASFACTAMSGETEKLVLGSHSIKFEAMGTAGDVAGTITANGMLKMANEKIVLAPAAITVLPPETAELTHWTIKQGGTAKSCAQIGADTGVAITITPMGGTAQTDIWNCDEPNPMVDVPYGAFHLKAELLDGQNATLATTEVDVPAGRGTITTAVEFSL